MESDPTKIWELVDKHFGANFFEPVVLKKYGYLFEDKDEEVFRQDMLEIRAEVKYQIEDTIQ
jgi:hypothetical protein